MEIDFSHKNCTFNLQINFGRHNAGLKFNYCLRFDLPNFSLPSTFKEVLQMGSAGFSMPCCRPPSSSVLSRDGEHNVDSSRFGKIKRHFMKNLFICSPDQLFGSVSFKIKKTTLRFCNKLRRFPSTMLRVVKNLKKSVFLIKSSQIFSLECRKFARGLHLAKFCTSRNNL